MSSHQVANYEYRSRVLVIDDEAENLELYVAVLSEDFDVLSSDSGVRGMDLVDSFKPEVLLLDIVLPDINGLEICKKLRANPDFGLLKILFVSGKTSLEERLEGYAVGADDYITKPVDIDELIAKVKVYSRLRKIEEIDVYKNTFMSLISHETITPLNAIIGFSDLITIESDLATVKDYAGEIKKAGQNLHGKIDKILLLNDIYNADKKFAPHKVNIANVVRDCVKSHRDNLKRKIITINTSGADVDRDAISNDQLCYKSIRFVLDNAVQYSPDGSEINISIDTSNGMQILNVVDQGPGMTESQIASIDEVFSCVDILHHKSGMGLSLAIAKAVMERFGGSLIIFSDKDGGTRISLQFVELE